MKLEIIYIVEYLFPRQVDAFRLSFLLDPSFQKYDIRKRFFHNKDDAEHFLNLMKNTFRTELPDYEPLMTKKNFRIRKKLKFRFK